MKKLLSILGGLLATFAFVGVVSAEVNSVTPSTNDINIVNGWANVTQVGKGIGTTDLKFTSTRNFYSCFEYRTDGDTSQKTSDTNYNTDITDGLYPYYCQYNNNRTVTIPANEYVEVRMVFGAEGDERFDWTRFDVLSKKVDVCHKEGKKGTSHLINISRNALQAHLNHGDAILGEWILNPTERSIDVTYFGHWFYTANFVQNGTVLTGTLSDLHPGGQVGPIFNGSINGNHVVFSFDYISPIQGVRTYDGTIQANGDLVGTWSQTGSQSTGQPFAFVIANFYSQVNCE